MKSSFSQLVNEYVAQIPYGRLMTYGQLAALAGNPRAARIVGGIAHYGNPDLPWHRVVNRSGGLASGYPGGRDAHAKMLESEGCVVVDGRVDIATLRWDPIGGTE